MSELTEILSKNLWGYLYVPSIILAIRIRIAI